MRADGMEAGAALAAGARLPAVAARRAWAPLGLTAVAQALVFAAPRLPASGEAAVALGWTGLALGVLALGPKLGALQRLAQGGRLADGLGAGGLQWDRVEGRLLATAVALTGLAGAFAATLAAPALAWLGAGGSAPLLAAPLGAGVLLALLALGRFAVTLAADAAEAGAPFARGWRLTRGRPLAPGLVLAAALLAPLAALAAAGAGMDGALAAAGRGWTLPGALGAGLLLGAAAQFGAAPWLAGALARLYLGALAREQSESSGDRGAQASYTAAPSPPDPAAP